MAETEEAVPNRWEIHGPFKEYRCTVNGWTVPLLNIRELDGGKVSIVLSNWCGYVTTVEQADALIPFLADVIATALGYRAHPQAGDDALETRKRLVAAVPHESLAPQPVKTIEFATASESASHA